MLAIDHGADGIDRRSIGRIADRRLGIRLVSLEERILFQLLLDEFAKLLVRQLQQLNSLLQLGSHYQRLALPEIKPLAECHDGLGNYRLNLSPR